MEKKKKKQIRRPPKRKITKKIAIHQRNIEPLSDYFVENRWDLNKRTLRCHGGCGFNYLIKNYSRERSQKDRYGKSNSCNACLVLRARHRVAGIVKPTREEYQEHARIYWKKKKAEYVEKFENKSRRIPKELHKSPHYTKIKEKLKNMTTKLEEKELLDQIKENHLDLAKKIEEETGIVINYSHENAFKLLGEPLQVAKKVARYISKTKANPDMTESEREKSSTPHFELYGLANSIGLSVEQLNRIIEADVELSDDVAIKGIVTAAMNQMKSYTLGLALDKNVVAKDVLKDFADKNNWSNNQDSEGNSVKIEADTLNNILNHLTETKLEKPEVQYIDVKENND